MNREAEAVATRTSRTAAEFWTDYQPGFRVSDAPVGSPEFFADVERKRYELEPAIREFARFDQWTALRVMEGGCGIATDGVNFARAGADYTGVDFSPTALELAQRRFELEGRSGQFVRASLTDIPLEDNSFDLVYSNGVIHHLPETEQAVNEFHRVLKPGGQAVVLVYHRTSLNYWFNIMVVPARAGGATADPRRRVGRRAPDGRGSRRPRGPSEAPVGARRALPARRRALPVEQHGRPGQSAVEGLHGARCAAALLRGSAHVETQVRWLNLRMYPKGERLGGTKLAERLGRRYGWHLWISATK